MAKHSAYYQLQKIPNNHDLKEIKQTISSIPGVISVAVGDGKDMVSVDFDSTGTTTARIGKKLQGLGHDAMLQCEEKHIM